MDEGQRRNVLLTILIGSLVFSVLLLSASAFGWSRDDAPTMPQLVVTRAAAPEGALELDVAATRIDMRALATTLDAAYAMGSATAPMTEEEARLIEAYLLGKAARAGREDAPSVVAWRGEAYRIELR